MTASLNDTAHSQEPALTTLAPPQKIRDEVKQSNHCCKQALQHNPILQPKSPSIWNRTDVNCRSLTAIFNQGDGAHYTVNRA